MRFWFGIEPVPIGTELLGRYLYLIYNRFQFESCGLTGIASSHRWRGSACLSAPLGVISLDHGSSWDTATIVP